MRKLFSTWSFWKHLLLSFFICLIIWGVGVNINQHGESSSIGIIGGADGPTAIFVTKHMFPTMNLDLAVVILFALLLALYIPIRNRLNKH